MTSVKFNSLVSTPQRERIRTYTSALFAHPPHTPEHQELFKFLNKKVLGSVTDFDILLSFPEDSAFTLSCRDDINKIVDMSQKLLPHARNICNKKDSWFAGLARRKYIRRVDKIKGTIDELFDGIEAAQRLLNSTKPTLDRQLHYAIARQRELTRISQVNGLLRQFVEEEINTSDFSPDEDAYYNNTLLFTILQRIEDILTLSAIGAQQITALIALMDNNASLLKMIDRMTKFVQPALTMAKHISTHLAVDVNVSQSKFDELSKRFDVIEQLSIVGWEYESFKS